VDVRGGTISTTEANVVPLTLNLTIRPPRPGLVTMFDDNISFFSIDIASTWAITFRSADADIVEIPFSEAGLGAAASDHESVLLNFTTTRWTSGFLVSSLSNDELAST